MTMLIDLMAKKSTDELRELAGHKVEAIAAAAQAVLDIRLGAQRPHGTGCTCCGAGVRQWR